MKSEKMIRTIYNKLPDNLDTYFLWLMCIFEDCAGMYFEEKEKNKLLELENKKLREKIDYLEEKYETEM